MGNETLCSAMPTVCSILRARPELDRQHFKRTPEMTSAGLLPPSLGVNFYRLAPGKRITPHFGANSRLVASMGIEVPDGAESTLRVGDIEKEWTQGKALVFDDSFE